MSTLSVMESQSLVQNPQSPDDSAIPGCSSLVDRKFLARVLRDLAPEEFSSVDLSTLALGVQFLRIRYKPKTKLVVVVSAPSLHKTVATLVAMNENCESGWNKLIAKGVPEHGRVRLSENQFAVRFPFDSKIPFLSQFTTDPAHWFRRLIPQFRLQNRRLRTKTVSLELVRYKPERHAVFFLRGIVKTDTSKSNGRWVVRLKAEDRVAVTSECGPPQLGVDHERGWCVEEFLPGDSLRHLGETSWQESLGYVRKLGSELREFHQATKSTQAWRAPEAEPDLSLLDSFPTALRKRWLRLHDIHLDQIRTHRPFETTRVHGDLHAGQVLCHRGDVRLVDWEKARWGDPAEDLGSFLASAKLRFGSASEHWETELLSGYKCKKIQERLMDWKAVGQLHGLLAFPRNLHPDSLRILEERLASLE